MRLKAQEVYTFWRTAGTGAQEEEKAGEKKGLEHKKRTRQVRGRGWSTRR